MVKIAIAESEDQKTATIVGEDIDLLVILIGSTQSYQIENFFKKIGKANDVKIQKASTNTYVLKNTFYFWGR